MYGVLSFLIYAVDVMPTLYIGIHKSVFIKRDEVVLFCPEVEFNIGSIALLRWIDADDVSSKAVCLKFASMFECNECEDATFAVFGATDGPYVFRFIDIGVDGESMEFFLLRQGVMIAFLAGQAGAQQTDGHQFEQMAYVGLQCHILPDVNMRNLYGNNISESTKKPSEEGFFTVNASDFWRGYS
jgi:hypothetical protein